MATTTITATLGRSWTAGQPQMFLSAGNGTNLLGVGLPLRGSIGSQGFTVTAINGDVLAIAAGNATPTVFAAGTTLSFTVASTAGTGTVTSVGMTVPGNMAVLGSPVMSAGTLAITSTTPNIQVFTATGSWTAPVGAMYVRVELIAGAPGGGGGGVQTSGTPAGGGSGGAGGGYSEGTFKVSDLASPVTVTVGTGGAGGAGAALTGGTGSNGSVGTLSSFGAYLTAQPGQHGLGGGTAAGAATAGGLGMFSGGAGAAGGLSGGGSNSGTGAAPSGASPGGGAGGGGIPAGATFQIGGNINNGYTYLAYPAISGGATDGAAGGAGQSIGPANSAVGGTGGAGGASSVLTTGGHGGAGAFPGGGGGGGGAGLTGTGAGGAGGAGAGGIVVVYSW